MGGQKHKRRVILRLNINDQLLFSQDCLPTFDNDSDRGNYATITKDVINQKANNNNSEKVMSKHIVVVDHPVDLSKSDEQTEQATYQHNIKSTKVYDLGNSVRCWHCTLEIKDTNTFLGCPVKYVESTERFYGKIKKTRRFQPRIRDESFECIGKFCSWSCVLSYAKSCPSSDSWLVRFMFKKWFKHYFPDSCIDLIPALTPAPPREALSLYGGPLSEVEYCKELVTYDSILKEMQPAKIYEVSRFPLIHVVQQIAIREGGGRQKKASQKAACNILDESMLNEAKKRLEKANNNNNEESNNLPNIAKSLPKPTTLPAEELFISIEKWSI